MSDEGEQQWDVFISHTSEDKETVARPLATALRCFGVAVWYDEFELKLGDSLSKSIDVGLASSRFGVVILSPAFFGKGWPERELAGLAAKEVSRNKVILPVWYDVTAEEVMKHSPTLADKKAIVIGEKPLTAVAAEIIHIVRPDIFRLMHARVAYLRIIQETTPTTAAVADLISGPVLHASLTPGLVRRVRLIRAALLEVYPNSMDWWLDVFKRDWYPGDEIEIWEHIAACYCEYSHAKQLSLEQKREVFAVLIALSLGMKLEETPGAESTLAAVTWDEVSAVFASELPLFDLGE